MSEQNTMSNEEVQESDPNENVEDRGASSECPQSTVSREAGSVNMFVMVVGFVLSIFLPISIYLAILPSSDDSVKPSVNQVTSEFSNQSIDNQP